MIFLFNIAPDGAATEKRGASGLKSSKEEK
jgi:hypothetical protein